MINMIKRFFADESGATMVEYALMLALIAIVALVAVILIGKSASQVFSKIGTSLSSAAAVSG